MGRKMLILAMGCLGFFTRLLAGVDTLDHPAVSRFGTDSISAFHLRSAWEESVWLSALPDGYKRITACASLEKGGYIPAQGSSKTRDYRLSAEGKTTWKGTALLGRFSYGRVLEDSTRLRHQTRTNPTAPVYFGSLRYNHYERSVYTVTVAGQRAFLSGKLPLTVALDYRVGEHFSNNDPRGAINDFQLDLLGGIGHRSDHWEYHVTGRYGYGRERVGIAFKNEKYTSNVEDPLYINWYMNGYGTAVQPISNEQRRYDDGFKRTGLGGHLQLTTAHAGAWRLDGGWLREVQRFKRLDESVQTYTLLNTYTLDRWSIALSTGWGHDSSWSTMAYLRTALRAGSDFEPFFQASNYTYRQEDVVGGVRGNAGNWQYGVGGAYQLVEQQDGSAGIRSAVSAWAGRANGGYVFQFLHGRQLRSDVYVRYRNVFSQELVFPQAAETLFNTQVVYPDFLYRAASTIQYRLSLAYGFPTTGFGWWEIALHTDYQQRGDLPEHAEQAPSVPGRNRWMSQLRVSLFF